MSTARPLRILVFMAKRTASRPVMGSTMPRVSLWPPFFPERESRTPSSVTETVCSCPGRSSGRLRASGRVRRGFPAASSRYRFVLQSQ